MPERKGDLDQVTMRRKKLRRADLETAATGGNPNAKGKSKQVKSRFSLGRNGGELRVYDISGHEEAIALTCDDNTFVQSVTEHPAIWIDSVRESLNEILRLRGEVRTVRDQQITTEVNLGTTVAKNTALSEDLQRANAEADRLRRRRNAYQAENVALMNELADLKEQVQVLSRDRHTNNDYNSDDGRPPRQLRIPVTQQGADAPFVGHTMKTRDTPIFSGDGDRDTYDAWKMSITSKVRNNQSYFTNEWRIIDYIRESVSGTAFNAIKSRCDINGTYPYQNHREVLSDLDNIFAIHDLIGRTYAKVNSQEMKMGPKEPFEEYYGRFLSCISPLRLDDRHKIELLKLNLTKRLSLRTSGLAGSTNVSFNEFCNNLKATDLDLRLCDERYTETKPPARTGRANRAIGTTSAAPWSRNWRRDDAVPTMKETTKVTVRKQEGPSMPPHIASRVRKEGRCFKCLATTHRSNDPDAPCRDSPFLTPKEMAAQLSTINIEWDGVEDETVDDDELKKDEASESENE